MRFEPGEPGASSLARLRTPRLLRPVGSSQWSMAAALAVMLGALLLIPALVGDSGLGAALALGFVLTAVPSLPPLWRPALTTMSVRAAAVMVGGALVLVSADRPVLLGSITVAAAVFGALVGRVGATAGLAVVLIAVHAGGGLAPAQLLPYALGAAAVFVAWSVWFGCDRLAGRTDSRGPDPDGPQSGSGGAGIAYGHALRVGLAVTVAVVAAGLLPVGMVGGHWLITSVLLTIQPSAADTGMRLAQRLSGNTVGALIAAVLLGTRPSAPVVVAATVVLFLVAVALRPVNYTWWAVTGPPVLLVISEYPQFFPWYEGGVRLAMNVAGAAVVVLVVFAVPVVVRRYRRTRKSDSLYGIQYKEAG